MATAAVRDVDFAHPDRLGNRLLPELDRLRETAPIFWSETAQGWVVTRHADVMEALAGAHPLSNYRFSVDTFVTLTPAERHSRIPTLATSIPHWVFNMDAPDHTRVRRLLTRAFGRKVIEGVRPFAQATIDRILSELPAGEPIEFIDTVARAITGRTILHLFGLPESVLDDFQRWSVALNTALGVTLPPPEALDAAERTLREMAATLEPALDARRENPTGDFLSQLVQAHEDGDKLTQEEVMGICYVALIAGHDTTMNSMALGVELLTRFPDQIDYLLDHPDDIVSSVVEISRLSAMSTGQARLVAEDFEWHGQQLRKGQVVMLMIAAANRDPRSFDHATALDLSRDTSDVATFGPGLHHCIGHLLAKLQLGEFFTRFFERFEVEMVEPELHFIPALFFRGLEDMRVIVRPRTDRVRQ